MTTPDGHLTDHHMEVLHWMVYVCQFSVCFNVQWLHHHYYYCDNLDQNIVSTLNRVTDCYSVGGDILCAIWPQILALKIRIVYLFLSVCAEWTLWEGRWRQATRLFPTSSQYLLEGRGYIVTSSLCTHTPAPSMLTLPGWTVEALGRGWGGVEYTLTELLYVYSISWFEVLYVDVCVCVCVCVCAGWINVHSPQQTS